MSAYLRSRVLGTLSALTLVALAAPASAAPVITAVGTSYATTPYTFTFAGGSFTFSNSGDIFGPTAIRTGGTGQVNTVFGSPTTYFVDRGTVAIGPGLQFAAFPTTTPVRFSNGDNFFGLSATSGADTFYGFAFTTNNILNSFGFETVAGRAITATAAIPAPVPEPATWAMMLFGFGAAGLALRRRARLAPLAA